jgi:hypothetical protein
MIVVLASACAGRAAPLRGEQVAARLPDARLVGSRLIVFRWEYEEGSIVARGEGIARLTAPDSGRLDLFLDGGFGGGWALIFGDSLIAPGGALLRNMLPPPPMLWAAVGRLAIPPAPDTVAAVDGSLLRADIGIDPTWRVSFDGDRLSRLERIEQQRLVEWVVRNRDGSVRYDHPGDTRSLRITITRVEEVSGFDPSIWRP